MARNVKTLGQVFTPNFIVADMVSLIKNSGNILEPSAGDGAFTSKLSPHRLTAIEYDPSLAKKHNHTNIDFFSYPTKHKFATIIGNPPYVRYQDITPNTKQLLENPLLNNGIDYSLFDNRSNLYLFFIYKAILHLQPKGELIFITPRDFFKSTAAVKLNEFIYSQGTITDIVELGDKKIFSGATPNTVIWRFEKDLFSRTTTINKHFILNKGQLLFTANRYPLCLQNIAGVKVGAVSGADQYFTNDNGIEFVCSYTNKTGKHKRMIYNVYHKQLEPFKTALMQRQIKQFDEHNWFEWGRKYHHSNKKRVYVNCKTRHKKPFFISKVKAYDGSVLAIFPHADLSDAQIKQFCQDLNQVDWQELGFVVDGRFIFSQRSLENTILPQQFKRYEALNDNKTWI